MSQRWTDVEFVVVDVETTSFDLDRADICEVAAVIIRGGEVTSQTFETLVNPRVPIEIEAQEVHGITDADVANAPEFIQIRRGLEEYLVNRTIIAHNAAYDIGRFQRVMRFYDFGRVLDTLALAVWCRNSSYIRRLQTLVKKYDLHQNIVSTYCGTPNAQVAHRAGYDAHASAHLFVHLVRKHFGPQATLDEIAAVCGTQYN
jgi:DNA polymerase III epsilon subunit family exonuclease